MAGSCFERQQQHIDQLTKVKALNGKAVKTRQLLVKQSFGYLEVGQSHSCCFFLVFPSLVPKSSAIVGFGLGSVHRGCKTF